MKTVFLLLVFLGYVAANGYNDKCLVSVECMTGSNDAVCDNNRCNCLPEFIVCQENCFPMGKVLGEKCTYASQCQIAEPKSECRKDDGETDFTCKCVSPRVPAAMTCVKALCVIGEACDQSALSEYIWTPDNTAHICNSSDLCSCAPGYIPGSDGASCVLDAKTEFQICTLPIQCPSNAACVLISGDTKCKCNNGYVLASTFVCDFEKKSINDSCLYDEQCPPHYNWNGTLYDVGSCNPTNCTCYPGFRWNAVSKKCVMDKLKINDTCVISTSCPPYYDDATSTISTKTGSCLSSHCNCTAGYVPSTDLTKCILVRLSGDQACMINEQCPIHVGGSAGGTRLCSGNCSCANGYQWTNGKSLCTIISKHYGDQCYDAGQCPLHTGGGTYDQQRYCTSGSPGNCTCFNGYTNATSGDCELIMKLHISDPCLYSDQCMVPQAPKLKGLCSGQCICVAGYVPNGAFTQCVIDPRELNQNCLVDAQCQARTKNSACGITNNTGCTVCICKAGYSRVDITCQAISKALFQYCSSDANCAGDTQQCKDGYCQCADGYKVNDNKISCVIDDKDIDQSCLKDEQCATPPFSKCQNGRCSCVNGYTATDDRTACVLARKPDGSPCVVSYECINLATCVAGVCTCAPLAFQSNTSSCEHALEGSACDKNILCPKYADCQSGICKCHSGFGRRADGYCARKIGTACDNNADCTHIVLASCTSNGNGINQCLCGNSSVPIDTPTTLEASCSGAERLFVSSTSLALLLILWTTLC